jgi:hypothetical protein
MLGNSTGMNCAIAPLRRFQSIGLTPTALTVTRTCPAPACGSASRQCEGSVSASLHPRLQRKAITAVTWGRLVRSGKADDLVPSFQEFGDDGAPDVHTRAPVTVGALSTGGCDRAPHDPVFPHEHRDWRGPQDGDWRERPRI